MDRQAPEWVEVTPEIAAEWLTKVGSQRSLSTPSVIQYATDMMNGRWGEDMMPLVFDVDGHLTNGQHRLSAVVQSGVTVGFWVRRDAPRESMRHMDTGRKRSTGDQLQVAGVANSKALAAAAKVVLCYEMLPDKVWSGSTTAVVTGAAVEDEVLTHCDSYAWALGEVRPARARSSAMKLTPLSALAVLVMRYSSHAHLWNSFIQGIATGANLSDDDVRLTVRSYFMRPDLKRWGGQQSHLLTLVKAWDKYVEDEPVRMLKTPRREELPMPKVK
jgi:hypothetical protein